MFSTDLMCPPSGIEIGLQAYIDRQYEALLESFDTEDTLYEERQSNAFYLALQHDLDIIETIARTVVSPKTRETCVAEMEAGRQRGWRL